MITRIHLKEHHTGVLTGVDRGELRRSIGSEYPLPLALSYRNFSGAVREGDHARAMMAFTNDLTSNVLHFLALILASEYINNAKARPLDRRVSAAIATMTFRPGPGKWLGFLREIYTYYDKTEAAESRFPQLLAFIEAHEINKKPAMIRIEENHGTTADKRFGFLEFLVALRNSFAHSKTFEPQVQQQLVGTLEDIADYLYTQLGFLTGYELYYPADPEVRFKGAILPEVSGIPPETGLWLRAGQTTQQLFPLIIFDDLKKKRHDLFMLEALQDKRIFYCSHTLMNEKRRDKDPVAGQIMELLEGIEVEPEVLDESTARPDRVIGRIHSFAETALAEYTDNGKYNPDTYVYPQGFRQTYEAFEASDKTVAFFHEEQGAGKSAFCAHLAQSYLNEPEGQPLTILIDARRLDRHGKIPSLFETHLRSELGVSGDVIGVLKKTTEKTGRRLRIVVDNLNEYFLKGVAQAYVLEQLMDFTQRAKVCQQLHIVAIGRPDFYEDCFSLYRQAFIDKIQDCTWMPEGKITVKLPVADLEEIARIWDNYRTHQTNYSPKTEWSRLSDALKEHCRRPLIMLFVLRYYDGEHIPKELSLKKIKKQYVRQILAEKPVKDLLFKLLKKMQDEGKVYLLTDDFSDKEIQELTDSSVNGKTQKPNNYAYTKLLDMQLIKEESFKQQGQNKKKLSMNNEMTFEVFNADYRKKIAIRNYINIGFMGLLIFGLLSIFINLISNQLKPEIQNYAILLDGISSETRNIINIYINHFIIADFLNFIKLLDSIPLLIVFIFVLISISIIYISWLTNIFITKLIGSASVMYYKNREQAIYIKFKKYNVWILIIYVILSLYLVVLFASELNNFTFDNAWLVLLFITPFLLSNFIILGWLTYRQYMKDKYFFEIKARCSNYKIISNLTLITVSFVIIYVCVNLAPKYFYNNANVNTNELIHFSVQYEFRQGLIKNIIDYDIINEKEVKDCFDDDSICLLKNKIIMALQDGLKGDIKKVQSLFTTSEFNISFFDSLDKIKVVLAYVYLLFVFTAILYIKFPLIVAREKYNRELKIL